MLIPRSELRFDFGAARFNLEDANDRQRLGWVFNQFLYGEVTGIQCGFWLYRAPTLLAAQFLAKQASEELSHVRRVLRILTLLEERPTPPHSALKWLSTGMMGATWGEHVALEMALGEGMVLTAFYALADTIDQPEIKKILETAVLDEERHVEFGEKETMSWLAAHPASRRLIRTQASIQLLALRWLKGFLVKKVMGSRGDLHPVFQRFDAFYDHVVNSFDLRCQRLGLAQSGEKLSQLGWALMKDLLLLPIDLWVTRRQFKGRLLTETFLNDPVVTGEGAAFREARGGVE